MLVLFASSGRGEDALRTLQCGRWQPRLVVEHGDLSEGNVVFKPRQGLNPLEFAVIDWAGARPMGHAIFDLIRLGSSMQIAPRELHRQLRLHAEVLDCTVEHTRFHLLSALGHLALNLKHFMPERFAQLAKICLGCIEAGLAAGVPSARHLANSKADFQFARWTRALGTALGLGCDAAMWGNGSVDSGLGSTTPPRRLGSSLTAPGKPRERVVTKAARARRTEFLIHRNRLSLAGFRPGRSCMGGLPATGLTHRSLSPRK